MRRLLPILVLLTSSALASETGYPLMTLFRQEQHHGGTQNFDVARDPRGRLYFANSDGLLIFDGAWWTRVDLPGPTAFNVASDIHGRVGVTQIDDIGILERGPAGTLAYRSLAPLVPEELRSGMGQADVCPSGDGLLFATYRFAAKWDGSSLEILDRTPLARGRRCTEVAGRNAIATFEGLMAPGEQTTFAGKRVDAVLPDMVIVRNEGLFHFDETPYDTDASRWLRGKGVMHGKVLRDGRIAIATLRDGLLILRRDATIDQIIDASAGLPEVFLFAVEQDNEGSLWLAMDAAIVRIDFASPVTIIDQRLGLTGGLQALGRHNGTLYAGTPDGIFAIDSSQDGLRARRLNTPLANNPWSLLSTHGDLLAGTYGGLLVVRENAPAEMIEGTADDIVYSMVPSRIDPTLVWLGSEQGLGKLRREGNGWRYEGLVKDSVPYARTVFELPDGTIWYASGTSGAIRMRPDGTTMHFGSGDTTIIAPAGRIVIVNREGFFQPGPNGELQRDPLLGHIQSSEPLLVAGSDARGNLWMSTNPPSVVRRLPNGMYEREPHAVAAIDGEALLYHADDDGAMWIGTERGLYRIAADFAEMRTQAAPAIHRVVGNGDRVLLDGLLPGTAMLQELPHRFGRVRIEVAPLSYRAKTQYQYRLDPIDAEWSAWTDQAFLDYTHLDANEYTFRVRTRGAAGVTSEEARWSFRVLAPWYATPWAIALWIVLAALLLGAVVWLRTRTLRLRARRLQSLVDEQTVMLRRANEQLERLSLADPLTGVANRRAFDRAMGEAWKRAVRHDSALAVIMLDLDHFKDLNDSRGHSAGDECLRDVARLLEGAIREQGDDVVARWGGEEFVILLGDANEASAVAVAQRIRAAIESLGITASLGVAVRGNDRDPSALIDRADRALYAAKRAGRNRVEVDRVRLSA